jgi:hypothetical protein
MSAFGTIRLALEFGGFAGVGLAQTPMRTLLPGMAGSGDWFVWANTRSGVYQQHIVFGKTLIARHSRGPQRTRE